jgi:hypothetical protein
MAVISEAVNACFDAPVLSICEPCRQISSYLPRIVIPTDKQNSAIEVLARSFLELDDSLMNEICGSCFTYDTDDCDCLIRYGKSVGAELSYVTIDSTNCINFGYEQEVDICCADGACKKKVFAYCHQLCQVCNVHKLDPCADPNDFTLYKKIVKFRATWFNSPPTRKNIVDSLQDWFGVEAHVVDAHFPNIYWSLGRPPTEGELAIMPFVYSMIPIQDGIDLIFTKEL